MIFIPDIYQPFFLFYFFNPWTLLSPRSIISHLVCKHRHPRFSCDSIAGFFLPFLYRLLRHFLVFIRINYSVSQVLITQSLTAVLSKISCILRSGERGFSDYYPEQGRVDFPQSNINHRSTDQMNSGSGLTNAKIFLFWKIS